MIKVVILSPVDYAGSGMQIVEAVRRHCKDVSINLITESETRFKHKTDILLRDYGHRKAQELVLKADIIHFKGDNLPRQRRFMRLVIPWTKKKIITVGGSGFRRVQGHKERWAKSWYGLHAYIRRSDLRTCITPDLNYPAFISRWTPHAIDTAKIKPCWTWKQTPLILHTPSERVKKGTDDIILPGIARLKKKYNFDFKMITGLPLNECINEKREASLVIDQCLTGWYGMNGVECLAMGIPVAAYLSDEALEQCQVNIAGLPILNTGNHIDDFCAAIEKYLKMTPDEKKELSRRSRAWAVKIHSYSAVGKMWGKIYKEL